MVVQGAVLAIVVAYPLDSQAVRCIQGGDHAPDPIVLAVRVGALAAFVFVGLMVALLRLRWAVLAGAAAIALAVVTHLVYTNRAGCG
jgi:hypothetical protein